MHVSVIRHRYVAARGHRSMARGFRQPVCSGTSVRVGTKPAIVVERRAIEEVATIEPTAEGDRAKIQNEIVVTKGCWARVS